MTELHKALDELPCRHMLAILDCCFAGAFRWSSTRDLLPLPPVIYQERSFFSKPGLLPTGRGSSESK